MGLLHGGNVGLEGGRERRNVVGKKRQILPGIMSSRSTDHEIHSLFNFKLPMEPRCQALGRPEKGGY